MKIPLKSMEQNNDFNGLARALYDEYYNREEVVKILSRLRKQATEYYIKRVSTIKNPIDTPRAANALGYMKERKAVEPLIDCLEWVNRQVVENKSVDYINTVLNILLGLGNIGDKRAIEPISNYLYHKNGKIRQMAVLALDLIASPESTDHLIQFLETPEFQKGDQNIKSLAGIAIIENGSDAAIDAILQTFDNRGLFINEFYEVLGKKTNRKILAKILKLVQNDTEKDKVSSSDLNIESTLKKIPGEVLEKNIDLLISSFRDNKSNVIVGIVLMDILGEYGGQEASDVLIEKLESEVWQFRLGACKAIGKIGDAGVVDALEKVTKDKKMFVRRAAKEAIKSIRKRKG